MVLSDIELRSELASKRLKVEPYSTELIGPSSIDLRLNTHIWEFPDKESQGWQVIDPSAEDTVMKDVIDQLTTLRVVQEGGHYELSPDQFILGQTLEYIELPNYLAARIEGKSSLARLGISIHATAPTVQAGYTGKLTLEITCVGPYRVMLKPGMPIAQLIVERLGLPAVQGYSGQFQGQR